MLSCIVLVSDAIAKKLYRNKTVTNLRLAQRINSELNPLCAIISKDNSRRCYEITKRVDFTE